MSLQNKRRNLLTRKRTRRLLVSLTFLYCCIFIPSDNILLILYNLDLKKNASSSKDVEDKPKKVKKKQPSKTKETKKEESDDGEIKPFPDFLKPLDSDEEKKEQEKVY